MGFPINTEVHSDTDIFLLAAHFCVFITYNSSWAVVINRMDHPINIGDYFGSPDKSRGQLRFAWKAIHIACDVGNRGQA